MLLEVRHDLPEVGFVKVPRDDGGSVRMFVDISTEHIVEFGQGEASICLWCAIPVLCLWCAISYDVT